MWRVPWWQSPRTRSRSFWLLSICPNQRGSAISWTTAKRQDRKDNCTEEWEKRIRRMMEVLPFWWRRKSFVDSIRAWESWRNNIQSWKFVSARAFVWRRRRYFGRCCCHCFCNRCHYLHFLYHGRYQHLEFVCRFHFPFLPLDGVSESDASFLQKRPSKNVLMMKRKTMRRRRMRRNYVCFGEMLLYGASLLLFGFLLVSHFWGLLSPETRRNIENRSLSPHRYSSSFAISRATSTKMT